MKKKASISPMQRSLKELRKQGYLCAITEKYNFFIHIRQDLFGIADIIALKGNQTLAVQTTSDDGGNISAHSKKIKANPNYKFIKKAGWKIEIWGWGKKGKRGKKKLWQCRIIKL